MHDQTMMSSIRTKGPRQADLFKKTPSINRETKKEGIITKNKCSKQLARNKTIYSDEAQTIRVNFVMGLDSIHKNVPNWDPSIQDDRKKRDRPLSRSQETAFTPLSRSINPSIKEGTDRKQESASLDRVRGDGRSMEREREREMGEYFVGEICHFYH